MPLPAFVVSIGLVLSPPRVTSPPQLLRSSRIYLCDTPPPTEPAPQPQQTDGKTYSDNWSGAGKYADEDPLPLSFWLFGNSPRRAILKTLPITLIGPAVNLWGSGSFLASRFPELSRDARVDTFYPVGTTFAYPYTNFKLDYAPGFQRYVDQNNRFEFRYPATYVQDQAVFLRNADRAYMQRTVDPQGVMGGMPPPSRRGNDGPIVALGPPDTRGEENLSVVVGGLQRGFTLRGTLGPPAEGAERLIQATIAKPGIREVTLLGAIERKSAKSGKPLYQFEYKVEYPGLEGKDPTYTICVVGAAFDTLYTFASRVPEKVWGARQAQLREAASSFVLL